MYGNTYCADSGSTVAKSSLPSWATGRQDWVTLLASSEKKKKEPKSLSIMDTTVSFDTCDYLLQVGQELSQFQVWQDSYDTLQLFIERCPLYQNSQNAFGGLQVDIQNLLPAGNYPQDSAVYAKYRAWLYSVLYLNTTAPDYFCACVEQIFGSFGYATDDTTHEQFFMASNGSVAFLKWLILNTDCDSSSEWNDWQHIRREQFQLWQQDSLDGIHYPYDTTIPTLSQIGYGLDTLLAKHAFYASVSETPQPGIISNPTAYPNPTSEGTVISFGISKEAYVKIELFDVLGHEVGSAGFESLFEPGNKSVPLSLSGLPSGTYFARIQTAYGEAQSVKLAKE